MKIAIIGAGWYGCHIARKLKKLGYDVTVFEKNADIFKGTSGDCGIRLHEGLHYPNSEETRKICRAGAVKFRKKYPELVIENQYSIYGLGTKDADNNPSKVSREKFAAVCKESKNSYEINLEKYGYKNLITAYNLPSESSIAVGKRLRETFRRYLAELEVNIKCNFPVKNIIKKNNKFVVVGEKTSEVFDRVINATSFQFMPSKLPFDDIETVYQPRLLLIYEDMLESTASKPISFIVMDGLFADLSPYNDETQNEKPLPRKYVLTHVKWTTLDTYNSPQKAWNTLKQINDQIIESFIKPKSEEEMKRFWPEFGTRFRYVGWKGKVLVKFKTNKEFRSAVTFEDTNGIINVFPGKVSHIFNAGKEVLALLKNQNILSIGNYRYMKEGVLFNGLHEITEKPVAGVPNSCNIHTYQDLKKLIDAAPMNPSSFSGISKALQKGNDTPITSKNNVIDITDRKKTSVAGKQSQKTIIMDLAKNLPTIGKILAGTFDEIAGKSIKNLEDVFEGLRNKIKNKLTPQENNTEMTTIQNKLIVVSEKKETPETTAQNTDIEKILFEIWKEIFPDRTFSATDHFRSLEGDDIALLKLLTDINHKFFKADQQLDLHTLGNDPTIRFLTYLIQKELTLEKEKPKAAEPIKVIEAKSESEKTDHDHQDSDMNDFLNILSKNYQKNNG